MYSYTTQRTIPKRSKCLSNQDISIFRLLWREVPIGQSISANRAFTISNQLEEWSQWFKVSQQSYYQKIRNQSIIIWLSIGISDLLRIASSSSTHPVTQSHTTWNRADHPPHDIALATYCTLFTVIHTTGHSHSHSILNRNFGAASRSGKTFFVKVNLDVTNSRTQPT